MREAENEKAIKIQQNEIYRLKALKKEVNARLAQVDENTKKNAEEEARQHATGQKRLGRVRFEDQELELKLSDEITGNLRTLKVRFTSVYAFFYKLILFYICFVHFISLKEI